mgnify:CR=1 FL=1
MTRGLTSDEEWTCLEPFATERGACSGRRQRDHRLVLDRTFWIARQGVAWRDLHEHFRKWSSVYRQFRRWMLSDLQELLPGAFNDSSAIACIRSIALRTSISGPLHLTQAEFK